MSLSKDTRPDNSKFRVFQVISKRVQPYFDYKQKCTGDDCEEDPDPDMKFEGFCVDLVAAIFKYLQEEGFNYTYTFKHLKDQEYGKYIEKEKKWNGLIGDLLNKVSYLEVSFIMLTNTDLATKKLLSSCSFSRKQI